MKLWATANQTLFDCVLENFLFQHICSPTRIRTGQTSNILDLVFTNEEGMIIKDYIKTDSPVGKSDHCMINFEFCCYIEDETFSRDPFSYFKLFLGIVSHILNFF